jgi:hypothetical protein
MFGRLSTSVIRPRGEQPWWRWGRLTLTQTSSSATPCAPLLDTHVTAHMPLRYQLDLHLPFNFASSWLPTFEISRSCLLLIFGYRPDTSLRSAHLCFCGTFCLDYIYWHRPSMSSGSGAAPPRASSPSNSFYALSDDEEGGYDTITHTESGRGVKLLFSKSKVSIIPYCIIDDLITDLTPRQLDRSTFIPLRRPRTT